MFSTQFLSVRSQDLSNAPMHLSSFLVDYVCHENDHGSVLFSLNRRAFGWEFVKNGNVASKDKNKLEKMKNDYPANNLCFTYAHKGNLTFNICIILSYKQDKVKRNRTISLIVKWKSKHSTLTLI